MIGLDMVGVRCRFDAINKNGLFASFDLFRNKNSRLVKFLEMVWVVGSSSVHSLAQHCPLTHFVALKCGKEDRGFISRRILGFFFLKYLALGGATVS